MKSVKVSASLTLETPFFKKKKRHGDNKRSVAIETITPRTLLLNDCMLTVCKQIQYVKLAVTFSFHLLRSSCSRTVTTPCREGLGSSPGRNPFLSATDSFRLLVKALAFIELLREVQKKKRKKKVQGGPYGKEKHERYQGEVIKS